MRLNARHLLEFAREVKLADTSYFGEFFQTQVSRVVLCDVAGDIAQFSSREPACSLSEFDTRGGVVAKQMDRQNISQGFGVKVSTQSIRLKLTKERHAYIADD